MITDPFPSEAGILNAFLIAPREMLPLYADRLSAAHFAYADNAKLFESILSLWHDGKPIEIVGIVQELCRRGLTQQEARCLFVDVSEMLPHTGIAPFFFDLVQDRLLRRTLIARGHALANVGAGDEDLDATLAQFETELAEIRSARAAPKKNTLASAMLEKINRMEHGVSDEDIVPTGLIDLDVKSPLRLGHMPLIAGERKAGKSILALNILTNCATSGIPALYFSLESPMPSIMDRLFALLSRVPMFLHTKGKLSPYDFDRMAEAQSRMMTAKLEIEDEIHSLDAITARLRVFREDHHGKAIACVDYAQLVDSPLRSRSENREQQVSHVSRTLRLTALELKLPILLVCQLNQDGATRDSRALEQDATAMWKLVRSDPDSETQRTIHIPWQRDGESQIALDVAFFGEIARIENLSTKQP